MSPRPLENCTLREKCVEADRLARELIDHIDQGFLHKSRALGTLVAPPEPDGLPVNDRTIRIQVAQVLESEAFTAGLYEETERFLTAIAIESERIASTGA